MITYEITFNNKVLRTKNIKMAKERFAELIRNGINATIRAVVVS